MNLLFADQRLFYKKELQSGSIAKVYKQTLEIIAKIILQIILNLFEILMKY